jgi:hypothetical protein
MGVADDGDEGIHVAIAAHRRPGSRGVTPTITFAT